MAESSKQGSKRAKKARLSIQAAIRNGSNVGIHISDEQSNEISNASSEELPNPSMNESQTTKKRRGPTYCKTMPARSENKIEVKFTEKNQPVGQGSVQLSTYLGVVAREMVPITYNDWRSVPENKKDTLWELVQQKFNLDEVHHKKYVLENMGKLLRAYRSTLTGKINAYRKKGKSLAKLKPKDIDSTQWEAFIKHRSSVKFKEISDKFKKIRSNHVLPHTCSRKGYARLEEEMKIESSNPSSISRVDVWENAHTKSNGQPSNAKVAECMEKIKEFKLSAQTSSSPSWKNDALSDALGPERRGRVRGVGFGVTPSKLELISQSAARTCHLEAKIASMEEEMQYMRDLIKKLVKNQDKGAVNEDILEKNANATSQGGSNFKKGSKCKLIQWFQPQIEVAKATWISNDPSVMVHNVLLGPKDSKVAVIEVIEPSAPLWKPTSDDVDDPTIEDALGTYIAWPTRHIIFE